MTIFLLAAVLLSQYMVTWEAWLVAFLLVVIDAAMSVVFDA